MNEIQGDETERLTLFFEGDELYDHMLAAVEAAHARVWMESYIFTDDEVGERFAEAFAAAARRGVDVRLHIDDVGSFLAVSRRMVRNLRRAGVRFKRFHRWTWKDPLRYNRRNHRKLLVIDRRIAYLGGFNIHRESSRRAYGEGRWRDTHVAIRGPLVRDAEHFFVAFWHGRRRWHPDPDDPRANRIVANNPRRSRALLQRLFDHEISRARRDVALTTPYYMPDRKTQGALLEAACRGVRVRLLVPGKSDRPVAQWAAQAAYANLLEAGVEIHEYQPRTLHAKTAVIDGAWATVGTANFDYRSFFVNFELNLVSTEPDLCRQLSDRFETDLAESLRVSQTRWRRRGFMRRVAEVIGWVARRWL